MVAHDDRRQWRDDRGDAQALRPRVPDFRAYRESLRLSRTGHLCGSEHLELRRDPNRVAGLEFRVLVPDIGGPLVGSWPAATTRMLLSKMVHLRRSVTLPAAIAMSARPSRRRWVE